MNVEYFFIQERFFRMVEPVSRKICGCAIADTATAGQSVSKERLGVCKLILSFLFKN